MSAGFLGASLAIWVLSRLPYLRGKVRQAAMRHLTTEEELGAERVLAGRGLVRVHEVPGIEFHGLCGQPVESIGGHGVGEVTCRRCRRFRASARKAAKRRTERGAEA